MPGADEESLPATAEHVESVELVSPIPEPLESAEEGPVANPSTPVPADNLDGEDQQGMEPPAAPTPLTQSTRIVATPPGGEHGCDLLAEVDSMLAATYPRFETWADEVEWADECNLLSVPQAVVPAEVEGKALVANPEEAEDASVTKAGIDGAGAGDEHSRHVAENSSMPAGLLPVTGAHGEAPAEAQVVEEATAETAADAGVDSEPLSPVSPAEGCQAVVDVGAATVDSQPASAEQEPALQAGSTSSEAPGQGKATKKRRRVRPGRRQRMRLKDDRARLASDVPQQ